MGNLKEIRTRISSVKSTKQITSAMKMVSASKLKKSQTRVEKIRPYVLKFNQIIGNLSLTSDYSENPYGEEREVLKRILVILVTSNRGLCGGFNMNAIKSAILLAKENYADLLENNQIDFLCIGKKGADYLNIKDYSVVKQMNELLDNPTTDMIHGLTQKLMNDFTEQKYDRIEIVNNKFINAASQETQTDTFLPIVNPKTNINLLSQPDYVYEPSKEYILEHLIPKSLYLKLYQAIIDSIASEHGARMTAMHQATDNATSLLGELTLQYNKARQANITNEILEIVSGAEALKK